MFIYYFSFFKKIITIFLIGFSSLLSAEVIVNDSWIRLNPPGMSMTAMYMSITNNSNKKFELMKVESDFFEKIEIHQTIIKGDNVSMVAVKKIIIEPKITLDFKESLYHLMLYMPVKPLIAKQQIAVKLYFSDGSYQVINSTVKKN